ncbi:hypothetical protein BTO04_02625 [Polaribacter sp. SA4-10]|uniref:BspA family leucine-rich repeat surface protein n=1 Tax=Polaribacter sp. SA4-10 TaxID=754397 RepID=UPI000B3C2B7D|nr:BspA family leucine-rich repeat surface protein [Polaribacter sp. SA4-10]ARV05657.1 hypothetical protein BTO04_02625 [Polaribacter sp. SA4-10]
MRTPILVLLLFTSLLIKAQTPISDDNFQQAINTCLSTNPEDGMCSDSEYGAMPDWDVSNVNTMHEAFAFKNDFNGDISNWDVSSVTNMSGMFYWAEKFSGDISNWDVSSVSNMEHAFQYALNFNGDVSNWDVSSVSNMEHAFSYTLNFDGDVSRWDVSSVANMIHMFMHSDLSTDNYDKLLNKWSTLSLQTGVTLGASGINYCNSTAARQSIISTYGWTINDEGFDCTNASTAINNTNFQQAINTCLTTNPADGMCSTSEYGAMPDWDVSAVTDMSEAFLGRSNFNGDISNWDVSNVTHMRSMFNNSALSTANYDKLLNGWSKLILKYGVTFSGGNSKYCAGSDARAAIKNDFGWTISDGGILNPPTLTAVEEDINENLDIDCNFTIVDYTSLTTSSGDCGTITVTQDPIVGNVINGHGTTQLVTLTASDLNGNSDSTTFNVTLVDNSAPTIVAKNIDVYLDGSGNGTIVAADIDGGSTDNCGIVALSASQTAFSCSDLNPIVANDIIITGVYDGPLPGGLPKGVELYVVNNIPDLAQYGLGSANNGGGTDDQEFTFPPGAATAGQFIHVASESSEFNNFFGFTPDYTTGAVTINGDDAIELFFTGSVIDVFGDINVDGNGQPWEYLDGWAYRNNTIASDRTTFQLGNWSFSGTNALDGETTNASAHTPVPVGSFVYSPSPSGTAPVSVTLTVTDANGNSATAIATVTVVDNINPTIATLTAISVNADTGVCTYASSQLIKPTADDNCSVASVVASPTSLVLGENTVTWTVTDGAGLTETSEQTVTVTQKPAINTVSPNNGKSGDIVTINGTNFGGSSLPTVTIGGVFMAVNSATETSIEVTLPADTCGGAITVTNSCGVTSGSIPYEYTSPTINAVSPNNGKSGDTVTINGTGFSDSSLPTVTIGGVSMAVNSATETSIEVTLPPNTCGGAIAVINSCGVTSNTKLYVYTPTTYTYNNGWSPSGDPTGIAVLCDNIIIAAGDATLASNTNFNTLTVAPGTSLTVAAGVRITSSTSITLESTSTSYSSLLLNGTIDGTVYYKRFVNSYTNDAVNNDNDLVSAPLTGESFGSFAAANANLLASGSLRAFAPFDKTTGSYTNYDTSINSGSSITAGTGYRIATNDGATVTFTGEVQTGEVAVDIQDAGPNYAAWNLIGNPYPSYVSASDFLNHEVATGVTNLSLLENASGIYGYDGDGTDGWDIITLANVGSRLLAPGQGFFVAADANYVEDYNLLFTPSMRRMGNNDDFISGRSANTLLFLKLKASTTDTSYKTAFYFNDNASKGLDAGYDAVIMGGYAPYFALYSHLVEENTGVPIALQALGSSDVSNITIPIGVNAKADVPLTFSISESNLPAGVAVYLEDALYNTTTLLTSSNYIVTPENNLKGTGRFFLKITGTTLSTDLTTKDYLQIYTVKSLKQIVIKGLLQGATSVTVYDMKGLLVKRQNLDASRTSNTIDVSTISDGVYVVKLENNQLLKTQKVIIK